MYTASFVGRDLINGVDYSLETRIRNSFGLCSDNADAGSLDAGFSGRLLSQGFSSWTADVADNQCMLVQIYIRRLSDGVVIDTAKAYVDNIA